MRLDHLLSGKQLQLFRWMLTLLAKLSDLGAAGAKTAFKIERPHLSVVGTSRRLAKLFARLRNGSVAQLVRALC